MRVHVKHWIVSIVMSCVLVTGCGKNVFQSYEKDDPAQKAANAMERGDPDKAIKILEAALEKDPNNYVYISLLSAAYGQKHGVDILDLALAMADDSSGDSSSGSKTAGIAVLWPILPEATEANLLGVEKAVALLVSIPIAERTNADVFKLAILSTASISLRIKSFDLNGDGELSTQELLAMDEEDATAIVDGLLAASSVLVSGMGENSDKATEKIAAISDAISSQDGDTNSEKLANYFAEEQAKK